MLQLKAGYTQILLILDFFIQNLRWFSSCKISFLSDGKKIDKTVTTMKGKKNKLLSTLYFSNFSLNHLFCPFSFFNVQLLFRRRICSISQQKFWLIKAGGGGCSELNICPQCKTIPYNQIVLWTAILSLKTLFCHQWKCWKSCSLIGVSQYTSAKQNSTKKHAMTILQYGQYKTQAHNHTQTAVLSLLALNGVA